MRRFWRRKRHVIEGSPSRTNRPPDGRNTGPARTADEDADHEPWAESLVREFSELRALVHSIVEHLSSASATTPTIREPEPPPVEAAPVAPDFDSQDPDERFAEIIHSFVGRAPSSRSNGELMDLAIIGRLRDGSVAWWNETLQTFGMISPELLGDVDPLPDDRLRGRVVSYPWGHVVTAIAPYSLTSPYATREITEFPTATASTVPEEAKGTFLEHLRPGDIVLARISFDGAALIDRTGRLGKFRPSVFIRWERDYALLRAIYDRNSYVGGRGLGIALIDSSALDKPSVVRNAEYDVKVEHVVRRLGRLGGRDLLALNIDDADETPPGMVRQATRRALDWSRLAEPLSREVRAIADAVRRGHPTSTDEQCLRAFAVEMRRDPRTAEILRTEGLHYATVGQMYLRTLRSLGIEPVQGGLASRLDPVLAAVGVENDLEFRCVRDSRGHPSLWLVAPGDVPPVSATEAPADDYRTMVFPSPRLDARLSIPDDYLAPDLVILDQFSTSTIVGDNRLDLVGVLADLRDGVECDAVVIGSGQEIGWRAFQQAAGARGWLVVSADERDEVARTAVDLARSYGAAVVTVVTRHADIVRELENSGFEVNIVSELTSDDDQ